MACFFRVTMDGMDGFFVVMLDGFFVVMLDGFFAVMLDGFFVVMLDGFFVMLLGGFFLVAMDGLGGFFANRLHSRCVKARSGSSGMDDCYTKA